MKTNIVIIAIMGLSLFLFSGCVGLRGHGGASTERNWYRPNTAPSQTAADLMDCRQRSGYTGHQIMTERAAAAFDSFVENCMGKRGYDWYSESTNPVGGLVSMRPSVTVRPLGNPKEDN